MTEVPRAWRPRTVLAVITAVVIVLAVVASFVVIATAYRSADHRATKYKTLAANSATQAAASHRAAARQYEAGLTDGEKIQKDLEKAEGLTYDSGWRGVFAGFQDPWIDNSWYLVKVKHGAHGHEFETRYDVRVCRSIYADASDNVYDGPYEC